MLSQFLNLYQRPKDTSWPAQGHSQQVTEPEQEPSSNSKPYPSHKHFCVPNISQTDSFKEIRYSFCAAAQPPLFNPLWLSSPESLSFHLTPLSARRPIRLPRPLTSHSLHCLVLINLPHTHSSAIQPNILSTNYARGTEQREVWNKARPVTLRIVSGYFVSRNSSINHIHKTKPSDMHLADLLSNKLKYLGHS